MIHLLFIPIPYQHIFNVCYCNIVNNDESESCFSLSGYVYGFINYSNFINNSVKIVDRYFIMSQNAHYFRILVM